MRAATAVRLLRGLGRGMGVEPSTTHRSRRLRIALILTLGVAGALICWQLLIPPLDPSSPGGESGFAGRICGLMNPSGLACGSSPDGRWSRLAIPFPTLSSNPLLTFRTIRIPVAFLGVSYFVLLATWFGTLGCPRAEVRAVERLPLHVAYCGLVMSVFYVGLMVTGASPWCAWCGLIHLINLVLVLGIRSLFRPAGRKAEADASTPRNEGSWPATLGAPTGRQILTSLALALVIIAAIGVHYRQERIHRVELRTMRPAQALLASLQRDPQFLLREYSAQARHDIPSRAEEARSGARARLIVFTDYECPSCYCFDRSLSREVMPLLEDAVDIVIRHYPLCSECNPSVEHAMHVNACEAARAAEAARLLGGRRAFERMHELLFEHREELQPDLYRSLASEAGLDPDSFDSAMRSETVRQLVQEDIDLAERLGVNGTPTILLDGRRVPQLCRTPVFWRAFAEARTRVEPADRPAEGDALAAAIDRWRITEP